MSILRDVQILRLPNGAGIYCLPRNVSTVELQIHIAGGSMHEGRFLGCGLAHFLEHMAFQGCKGFPGSAVADTVNVLGGEVNAYTACDRTCYRMQLPAAHWRRGVEMLSAMVRFPELPEARFKSEREVILRECDRCADNPDNRLYEAFMKRMFLTHPMRHPVIGYREMIAEVSADMAREYHRSRYTPDRCVVVAVGGVDPRDVFSAAEEYLGSWRRGHLAEEPLPEEPYPAAVRTEEIAFADPLFRMMFGVRAPRFGSPELPALELLFGMLGAGDGSLLNRKLVLDAELALDVKSAVYTLGGQSVAVIGGKCEPEKLTPCCDALRRELECAAAGKISEAELEREKGQQYADRLRELRDGVNLAGEIAGGVIYAGSPTAGDAYLEMLNRTGLSQVKAAAAKYLDEHAWVRVVQRNERPVFTGGKRARKRELHSRKTASGGTAIYAPDRELPLCNFFLALPGGAVTETAETRGLSKLTAAALLSGSENLPEKEILRRLDAAGADVEISGGLNSLTLEFSSPRRSMDQAVGVLAEILHAPRFPEAAWAREKNRQLNLIRERENNPVQCAFNAASEMLYGVHPYADGGYGTAETLTNLERNAGAEAFSRWCCAPRAVWGFGGDCSEAEAEAWQRRLEGAVHWGADAPLLTAVPRFPGERKLVERSLPREQTAALRMLPGISCSAEPEMMNAADVLFQAENGLGAKLFRSVREKHALSYAVGMSYAAGFHPGYFAFYALTAPHAGRKVLELLDAEIVRLAEEGLEPGEFNAAKNGAAFEVERSFDTPESLLRSAGMEAFYGFVPEDLLTRVRKIQAMTPAEFNAGLRRIFVHAAGVEALVLGRGE